MYERGLEHLRDLEELKSDSHMVKHFLDVHQEEEIGEMKFGARIVKQTRSAFTRQIGESVVIQTNKEHYL